MHQGRATVAMSIALANLWYVVSALPLHQKEVPRSQQVIPHYMIIHKNIQWDNL